MTTINTSTAASPATTAQQKYGFAALGSGDFLKLMTTQLRQQDPFDPVDNKEMLAQMAQFTQLSGITDMGATLKTIADKLDAVIAAQQAAATSLASLIVPPAATTALTPTNTV